MSGSQKESNNNYPGSSSTQPQGMKKQLAPHPLPPRMKKEHTLHPLPPRDVSNPKRHGQTKY